MAKWLPCDAHPSPKMVSQNVDAIGLGSFFGREQDSGSFPVFQDLRHGVAIRQEGRGVSKVEICTKDRVGSSAVGDLENFISLMTVVSGTDNFKVQEYSRRIAACFPLVVEPSSKGCTRERRSRPGSYFSTVQSFPPSVCGSCSGIRILSAEGLSPVFRANKKHPAVTAAGCDETKHSNGK